MTKPLVPLQGRGATRGATLLPWRVRARLIVRVRRRGRDTLRPDSGGNSVRAYWQATCPRSVGNSRVHSAPCTASARTSPDSLRCRKERTRPDRRLTYSIVRGSIQPPPDAVKRDARGS